MKIKLPPHEREYIRQGLNRLGMSSLREYHRSIYWTVKHVGVRRRRPCWCERCGTAYDVVLHHKTYKNLGNERDEDLEFLCGKCHQKHHERQTRGLVRQNRGKPNRKPEKALKRVLRLKQNFQRRIIKRVGLDALYGVFTRLAQEQEIRNRKIEWGLCPRCQGWGIVGNEQGCPDCKGKGTRPMMV